MKRPFLLSKLISIYDISKVWSFCKDHQSLDHKENIPDKYIITYINQILCLNFNAYELPCSFLRYQHVNRGCQSSIYHQNFFSNKNI